MDKKEYLRVAATAKRRRDEIAKAAVQDAIRKITAADYEYRKQVDGLTSLRPLVSGGAPELSVEPLKLDEIDGWNEFQKSIEEPETDIDRVRSIIPPRNKEFTLDKARELLAEKYPGQEISDAVWYVYLNRLCRNGDIILIKRQRGSHPAVYAAAGSVILQESEEDKKPLGNVAMDIIREAGKGLTMEEITSAAQQLGRGQSVSTQALRSGLLKGLKRRADLVHQRNGKWILKER